MHISKLDTKPPYYAVIFTATRTSEDNGYHEMSQKMVHLATRQPGFIGLEYVGGDSNMLISYWESLDAIKTWKENAEHGEAQRRAREWYRTLRIRIARVERDYGY